MRNIPLSGGNGAGKAALVDDEDYELVGYRKWYLHPGGYATSAYWRGGKQFFDLMHKLITGWRETDHIDHNGLNNQRSNLRDATHQQNSANQSVRPHASRYKGVTFYKRDQIWVAQIAPNGRNIYLGRFRVEEDAARAYDAAARKHFGQYACLNFPDLPAVGGHATEGQQLLFVPGEDIEI